ncbi:TetR family transcriptional regulator [Agromyces bauzanensis]
MREIIVEVFNGHGTSRDGRAHREAPESLEVGVYHHFDPKAEMLELALDRVLGALEAVFEAREASQVAALERTRLVMRGAAPVACEQHSYLMLLLRLRGSSEIERQAKERRRAFDARLRPIFELSLLEGRLCVDIDSRPRRALHLWPHQLGRRVVPPSGLHPKQIADAVLLFMRGGLRLDLDGIRIGPARADRGLAPRSTSTPSL